MQAKIDNLLDCWKSTITQLAETATEKHKAELTTLKIVQTAPHTIVYDLTCRDHHGNGPTVQTIVDRMKAKRYEDNAYSVFEKVSEAWSAYKEKLLSVARFTHFEANEARHTGYTNEFFSRVSIHNMFTIPLWTQSFSTNIPESMRILHNLSQHVKDPFLSPVASPAALPHLDRMTLSHPTGRSSNTQAFTSRFGVNTSNRPRTTADQVGCECECEAARAMSSLITEADRCASELKRARTAYTSQSLTMRHCLDTLQCVKAADALISTGIQQLTEDPLSIEMQSDSTYQATCQKCFEETFASWMRFIGDDTVVDEQQGEFIDEIDKLVKQARKDSSKLVGAFKRLRSIYQRKLDSETRTEWMSVIQDFYARAIEKLGIKDAGKDGVVNDDLLVLQEQLRRDSSTIGEMFNMLNRGTKAESDEALKQELATLQRDVDTLCAVSDASDAIESIAGIARQKIADHFSNTQRARSENTSRVGNGLIASSRVYGSRTGDLRGVLLRFVTGELNLQRQKQFTPEAFRVAFTTRSLEMTRASEAVRSNMKQLLASLLALKAGYVKHITGITNKLEARVSLLRTELSNLSQHAEPQASLNRTTKSDSCKIPLKLLRPLQQALVDLQKAVIEKLSQDRFDTATPDTLRIRTHLTRSKEFAECSDADTTAAWKSIHGVMQVTVYV